MTQVGKPQKKRGLRSTFFNPLQTGSVTSKHTPDPSARSKSRTLPWYSAISRAIWEVSVWAKNLFDKEAQQGIVDEQLVTSRQGPAPVPPPSGYTKVRTIPERTLGITGKYNFSR